MDYIPHGWGILAALDDPEISDIYCMKGSQVAWTTMLLVWILGRAEMKPGVMIGMFASEGAGKDFSQEKFTPLVSSSSTLAEIIDVSTTRKAGNTMLHRSFPGGYLKLIGSNAVRSVKSTTAPVVFVEEPDDANENVADQGDSIKLLYERTKRARKPKRILGGTPSVKGFSRVEEHINRSDKRVLPVECHLCGNKHVLTFENVRWLDADTPWHDIYGTALPETAVYQCPDCEEVWDDWLRQENIRSTVEKAMESGDPYCGWVATQPEITKVAGFMKLGEVYSCLPGVGLQTMVENFLEAEYYAAQGDETKRIVFVNASLGEPYEFKDNRENADSLRERAKVEPASQHRELTCPKDGLIITVGIDVQHDRLAIIIRAWGVGAESWLMYWGELAAESTTVDRGDHVWKDLDALVFQGFEHLSGGAIYAAGITIDSSDGTTSDAVYEWVKTRKKKYTGVQIMAGKGSSAQTDPEIFTLPKAAAVDPKNPNRRTKADRRGLKIFIVGTNKAKDWLSSHMALQGEGDGRFHYYHPDDMRHDYFDQMSGEAKVPNKRQRGRRTWQQKAGRSIEAWDCEVYSLHAARSLKVHTKTPDQWAAQAKKILQADLFNSHPGRSIENETAPARRQSTYW